MKNKTLVSVFSSLFATALVLSPVSFALAEDSTSTVDASTTTINATSTGHYYRDDIKNFMEKQRENQKKVQEKAREDLKKLRDSKMEDFRNASGTRADWKNASGTASSTNKDKKDNKNKGLRLGDKFKLNVASTTQNLLNISNKLGALGDKIKAVVDGQASSSDVIANAVNNEEGRGFFAKFLFGADYKNIGVIISQVSGMQARVDKIENQISKMATSSDKTVLQDNVQTLKDQISTLEQYVKDNINKFSLFGWFTNRFSK